MSKRWNVYHGAETLGLMTAKEIREALRQGTLDPFDKVSVEGSNIREDLIEVDEIFKESAEESTQVEAPAAVPLASAANLGGPPRAVSKAVMAPSFEPTPTPSPAPLAAPAPQPSSWVAESSISMRKSELTTVDKDAAKNTQKRYYLIDRSKILGPLSALEIQSLFNRGMVNQKVKVQRIGNTRSIPIAQFIASYSEDRLKELTEDGKLQQKMGGMANPSSKVMNELARAANAQKLAKVRKSKTYAIIGAVGLILGALLFLIVESSRSRPHELSEDPISEETTSKKPQRPRLVQKAEPTPKRKEPERIERPEPEAKEERTPPARAVQAPPPVARKPQPPKPPKPKTEATKEKETPRPKPAAPKVASKAAAKASAAPAAKPVAQAPKKAASSPIAKTIASGGGIQTVGPVSFNAAQLEACSSKCLLTFTDGSGLSMKGSFFKGAYYDQLSSSSGSVTLTGTVKVEGSSLTLLIMGVR